MHPAAVAVGGGFGVGHHRLDRDVGGRPAPAAGDACHLLAQAVQLSRRRRQRPGVGLTAHAGTGQGDAVAVAPPGVGRQVCREGMEAMDAAITANDLLWFLVYQQNPRLHLQ